MTLYILLTQMSLRKTITFSKCTELLLFYWSIYMVTIKVVWVPKELVQSCVLLFLHRTVHTVDCGWQWEAAEEYISSVVRAHSLFPTGTYNQGPHPVRQENTIYSPRRWKIEATAVTIQMKFVFTTQLEQLLNSHQISSEREIAHV